VSERNKYRKQKPFQKQKPFPKQNPFAKKRSIKRGEPEKKPRYFLWVPTNKCA